MLISTRVRHANRSRRGTFLVVVVVLMTFMMGLTMAFFTTANSGHKEIRTAADRLRSHQLAQAAIYERVGAYETAGQAAVDALPAAGQVAGVTYQATVVWGAVGTPVAPDLVVLTGTATAGNQTTTLELVGRTVPGNPYVMGIAAKNDLDLSSNVIIDSYDSTLGTYASQLTDKWHGLDYANPNAPVNANGDIGLGTNSAVLGDAHPGTSGTINVTGNSQVDGDTSQLEDPIVFPPIVVPAIPQAGTLSVPSGTVTMPPGDYGYDEIDMDSTGTLIFTGPANVLTTDMVIDSNAKVLVDATNGPVNFYVTGDYTQSSNTFFEPLSGDPADLNLFIFGSGSPVEFNSNTTFTGICYAPDRDVVVESYATILGSLAASSIKADSNAAFHYDENLAAGGLGQNKLDVVCWRPVANP